MTKRELHESIATRMTDCTLDDLRVLEVVLQRLELGRRRYGPLDLNAERFAAMDFDVEIGEELADAVVYRAMARLRR